MNLIGSLRKRIKTNGLPSEWTVRVNNSGDWVDLNIPDINGTFRKGQFDGESKTFGERVIQTKKRWIPDVVKSTTYGPYPDLPANPYARHYEQTDTTIIGWRKTSGCYFVTLELKYTWRYLGYGLSCWIPSLFLQNE